MYYVENLRRRWTPKIQNRAHGKSMTGKMLYLILLFGGGFVFAMSNLIASLLDAPAEAVETLGVLGIIAILLIRNLLDVRQPSNSDILDHVTRNRQRMDEIDRRIANIIRDHDDTASRVQRLEKQPPPG